MKGSSLKQAVEDGVVLLSICGGYQLLGHFFRTGTGETLPGISLFDAWTIAGERRFIGNVLVESTVARGDPNAGRLRESQRAHLPRQRHASPRPGRSRVRQQRRRRHRGRGLQERLRLLPARLPVAEEPLVRGPPNPDGPAATLWRRRPTGAAGRRGRGARPQFGDRAHAPSGSDQKRGKVGDAVE